MGGIIDFATRNYKTFKPTEVPKNDKALRFGVLGAANIA